MGEVGEKRKAEDNTDKSSSAAYDQKKHKTNTRTNQKINKKMQQKTNNVATEQNEVETHREKISNISLSFKLSNKNIQENVQFNIF